MLARQYDVSKSEKMFREVSSEPRLLQKHSIFFANDRRKRNRTNVLFKIKGDYFSASGVRELHFACNCDNQIVGSKNSYFYTGNCHWNYNLRHSSDIIPAWYDFCRKNKLCTASAIT